ncbi:MAG: hypothetical protein ACQESP_08755 [Candidatus Muiribacteriota bacterium]
MDKALENKKVADICKINYCYNAWGNRIYYCFYQLTRLITNTEKTKYNGHKDFLAVIKKKGYKDLFFLMKELKGIREKADYYLYEKVTISNINEWDDEIETLYNKYSRRLHVKNK